MAGIHNAFLVMDQTAGLGAGARVRGRASPRAAAFRACLCDMRGEARADHSGGGGRHLPGDEAQDNRGRFAAGGG
jgi:hypothetical protein